MIRESGSVNVWPVPNRLFVRLVNHDPGVEPAGKFGVDHLTPTCPHLRHESSAGGWNYGACAGEGSVLAVRYRSATQSGVKRVPRPYSGGVLDL